MDFSHPSNNLPTLFDILGVMYAPYGLVASCMISLYAEQSQLTGMPATGQQPLGLQKIYDYACKSISDRTGTITKADLTNILSAMMEQSLVSDVSEEKNKTSFVPTKELRRLLKTITPQDERTRAKASEALDWYLNYLR